MLFLVFAIALQSRDFQALAHLAWYRFSLLSTLRGLLWPSGSERTAERRLGLLSKPIGTKKAGYISRFKIPMTGETAYHLTRWGLKAFSEHLRELGAEQYERHKHNLRARYTHLEKFTPQNFPVLYANLRFATRILEPCGNGNAYCRETRRLIRHAQLVKKRPYLHHRSLFSSAYFLHPQDKSLHVLVVNTSASPQRTVERLKRDFERRTEEASKRAHVEQMVRAEQLKWTVIAPSQWKAEQLMEEAIRGGFSPAGVSAADCLVIEVIEELERVLP